MEEQEQLPLDTSETALLRVSPGMAVSGEHLEKLGSHPSEPVDGVGPMEVWATYGEIFPTRIEGEFKRKRVGWDEARRLQELVREAGWSPGGLVHRGTIEGIAKKVNGDLLSACEAIAEMPSESRSLIFERCKEVVAQGAPSTLISAVSSASKVRNDDLRVPREVIELTLWLLSCEEENEETDLLRWMLHYEENKVGLTGVIGACDELYTEVTGSRPSSTLQSRLDRTSTLRFRVSVTDATPMTPALIGEVGAGTVMGRDDTLVEETSSGELESAFGDELATTLVDLPSVDTPVADELNTVAKASDGDSEEASAAAPSPVPEEVEPTHQTYALNSGETGSEVPVEDRLRDLEKKMDELAVLLETVPQTPSGVSGGTFRTMLVSVSSALIAALLVLGAGKLGGSGETSVGEYQTAPRISKKFAQASFGEITPDAVVGGVVAEVVPEPSQKSTSLEGKVAQANALSEKKVPPSGNPPSPVIEESVGIETETAAVNEQPLVKPALETDDSPPSELVVEEAAEAEPAAQEASEQPETVQADELAVGNASDEDVANDSPDNGAQGESPEPPKSGTEDSDGETKAKPLAKEQVAEKYGLGFKATHRLTKRTKLFQYGSRNFIEVTALPGGDALVDECIVAKAPRRLFRHKIYKGYQTIYLSCAGEMKVICEQLGCKPQQRCITTAGWVKPCKKGK